MTKYNMVFYYLTPNLISNNLYFADLNLMRRHEPQEEEARTHINLSNGKPKLKHQTIPLEQGAWAQGVVRDQRLRPCGSLSFKEKRPFFS